MNSANPSLDRFLAFDTAGETIHCALNVSGAIQCCSAIRPESRARNVAVLTEELLRETALSFADIRGVIVALGPGSFTGLRVGLSFAKGLVAAGALPLAIPLVGVTRFAQVLYQIRVAGRETPDLMFVKMNGNRYYCYRRETPEEAQVEVVTVATLADFFTEKQAGAGSCASCYFVDCEIPPVGEKAVTIEKTQPIDSTLEGLFGAAAEQFELGNLTHWTELEPLYVQPSGAELRAMENTKKRLSGAETERQNANSKNV